MAVVKCMLQSAVGQMCNWSTAFDAAAKNASKIQTVNTTDTLY